MAVDTVPPRSPRARSRSPVVHRCRRASQCAAFYRGPYSARAIQGDAPYPGRDDWRKAGLFFRTAVELCCGTGLVLAAEGGRAAALFKRAFWPLVLLALPGVFYL